MFCKTHWLFYLYLVWFTAIQKLGTHSELIHKSWNLQRVHPASLFTKTRYLLWIKCKTDMDETTLVNIKLMFRF